jgi:Secretion system C-terminal sorting domain
MKKISTLICVLSLCVMQASASIVLNYFEATIINDNVKFEWETESEFNSMLFQVQRTADGGATWYTISSLPGSNNSSISVAYETYDNAPMMGTNTYRLRQMDVSGSSWISETVTVTIMPGPISAPSLYPNPVSDDEIIVSTDEPIIGMISVLNMMGQVVMEETPMEGQTLELKIHLLPPGTYYMQLRCGDQKEVKRFVRE